MRENLEVVRKFENTGYSGKFLERYGLDVLRNLVAASAVDVVMVSEKYNSA